MTLFRKKAGEETLARLGGGLPMSQKALGETIGQASSAVKPSEEDGDGDGFRTGRDGRDNIPVTKPVVNAIKELWSDKRQNALKKDEERIAGVAKKLKGRKPKYKVKELEDLINDAKSREDIAKARREVRQLAKSIFELDGLGQNGEYKTRIYKGKDGVRIFGSKGAFQERHPYSYIEVSGEVLDKDGNKVGMFIRKIYMSPTPSSRKGPHVYHDYLRLDADQKGQGIGSDFTLATEMMYKQMGINEVHLNAALSDGAYTWLRAGYNFKSDEERKKVAKIVEERYQMMLKDAGSKEKLVAGGFMTAAGRHHSDPGDPGDPVKMPKPMFESMEDLDKFLKILGQLKTHEVGSEKQLPPIAVTLFGEFSKRMLKGVVVDVKKPIGTPNEEKSLTIRGFDKLFTRV
jgi:hypothetical protein